MRICAFPAIRAATAISCLPIASAACCITTSAPEPPANADTVDSTRSLPKHRMPIVKLVRHMPSTPRMAISMVFHCLFISPTGMRVAILVIV